MGKLDQLIQQVRTELGVDYVATDVVGMDGISVAGGSINPDFNATDASARFAMVMKLALKACEKISVGKVDDNLATTDKVYLITRFLGDGSYYWGLTVTRNATLGAVRMIMNEYADQLWDAIPR